MSNEQLLDHFAGIALSALISKMPLFDAEGKIGAPTSADELQDIRKQVAATAYNYASWMLIAKNHALEWLKENEKQ